MTDSMSLIPEPGDMPSVEQVRCYSCGGEHPHMDMSQLWVTATFKELKTGTHTSREIRVYLCAGCQHQGERFALNPLGATVRMTPEGRLAKSMRQRLALDLLNSPGEGSSLPDSVENDMIMV